MFRDQDPFILIPDNNVKIIIIVDYLLSTNNNCWVVLVIYTIIIIITVVKHGTSSSAHAHVRRVKVAKDGRVEAKGRLLKFLDQSCSIHWRGPAFK